MYISFAVDNKGTRCGVYAMHQNLSCFIVVKQIKRHMNTLGVRIVFMFSFNAVHCFPLFKYMFISLEIFGQKYCHKTQTSYKEWVCTLRQNECKDIKLCRVCLFRKWLVYCFHIILVHAHVFCIIVHKNNRLTYQDNAWSVHNIFRVFRPH